MTLEAPTVTTLVSQPDGWSNIERPQEAQNGARLGFMRRLAAVGALSILAMTTPAEAQSVSEVAPVLVTSHEPDAPSDPLARFAARADSNCPIITAHRGAEGVHNNPEENSWGAMRRAQKGPADAVEFDNRLNRSKWYVMHDPTVNRVTRNGHGKIARMTNRAVNALRLNDGSPVLSSWQMVRGLAHMQAMRLQIEVKPVNYKPSQLKHLAEMVLRNNVDDRTLFTSSSPAIIRQLEKYVPDVPKALIIGNHTPRPNLDKVPGAADMINVNAKFLTADLIRAADRHGLLVGARTTGKDTRAMMERVVRLGAVNLVTDNAPLARQVRGNCQPSVQND